MAYIHFADFMFLKLFGSQWTVKFLTLQGNEHDKYAVAVKRGQITAGYVPREISKTCWKHGGSLTYKAQMHWDSGGGWGGGGEGLK